MFTTAALFNVVSQPFKRSQLGLFHGKMKQYGNNNPFSKKKTRRTWLPNIQRKHLTSDLLGETLRLKVTTRALRTIKKYNGLDNYILKANHKFLGWEGMRLRIKMREAQGKIRPATGEDEELQKLRKLVDSPAERAQLRRRIEEELQESSTTRSAEGGGEQTAGVSPPT